jgi:hypothetical protein
VTSFAARQIDMMFEAFGFMQERTLRCRKLSQLPSGGLLWQYLPAFLIFSCFNPLSKFND